MGTVRPLPTVPHPRHVQEWRAPPGDDPQLRLVEFGPNGLWRKSRRGRLSQSATLPEQTQAERTRARPDSRMDSTHLVTAGPQPVPLLVQQPSGRSCRARNHRSAIPPRGDSHRRCRSQAHRRSDLRGPHSFPFRCDAHRDPAAVAPMQPIAHVIDRCVSRRSYGVPEGLICGVPVTCTAGGYRRVEGLPIDDFAHGMIDRTVAELKRNWLRSSGN